MRVPVAICMTTSRRATNSCPRVQFALQLGQPGRVIAGLEPSHMRARLQHDAQYKSTTVFITLLGNAMKGNASKTHPSAKCHSAQSRAVVLHLLQCVEHLSP